MSIFRLFLRQKLILIFLAVLALSVAANAQVPDTAGVGQLQRQFDDRPLPQSKPKVVPVFPRQQPDARDQEGGQQFKIHSVEITGAEKIPLADLKMRAALLTQQPVSLDVIQEFTAGLTIYLREQGYLLSSVEVPAQDVSTGVLRLHVVEQGLSEMLFTGEKRLVNAAIAQSLKQRLLNDQPLQQATLERVLLTLNRFPGVRAESTLFPGRDGTIGLKIQLTQDRLQGFASLDNRGSRYVGSWQVSVANNLNGVIAPFDRVFLRGLTGTDNQELRGFDSYYQLPLNSQGTTLKVAALRVWSEPGYTLKSAQLENVSSSYSAGINHPVMQERSRSLILNTKFNVRNASSKTFGTYLSDDKTRSVSLGATFDNADSLGGLSLFDVNFSQGLNILGARQSGSALLSRSNGKSDFGKIDAYLSRSQYLNDRFALQIAVDAQYALSQLLSGEEFGYGGSQFGRGYDPSELVGDHGVSGLIELQYRPAVSSPVLNNVQLYTSYDIGSVWAIDADTRFDQRTAASAAIGMRFDINNRLSLDMQLAKPLTRGASVFPQEKSNDPRGFLSITTKF